jgi:hypothetical protein
MVGILSASQGSSSGSINMAEGGGAAGGVAGMIGDSPRGTTSTKHNRTSSAPFTIDKFIKSLLPASSFPSQIGYLEDNSDSPRQAPTSSSSASVPQLSGHSRTTSTDSPVVAIPVYDDNISAPTTPGKSKIRAPRSSVGAGRSAHAHRHNLSLDQQTATSTMGVRTRIRPEDDVMKNMTGPSTVPRTGSAASSYAGGIGE